MIKIKYLGSIVILTLFFSSLSFASNSLTQALDFGTGVRALSMGGAFTAVAEGPDCLFYNPAGLVIPGFSYTYNSLDYKQNSNNKFDNQSFYFSPFGFSYWVKENKNNDSVEVSSYSFGKPGKDGIHWGLTYKNIKATTSGITTSGWSTDIGLLVNFTPNINFGLLVQDFFNSNIEPDTRIRSGLALFNNARTFILSTDVAYNPTAKTESYVLHSGFEYQATDGMTLRFGGYQNFLTGGINVELGVMSVDAGVIINQVENEKTYLLSFKFGTEKNLPNQRRYSLLKPKAYAEFCLNSSFIEGKSDNSLLGGQKIGSNDLLNYVHEARLDPGCQGFIIRVGDLNASLSSIALVQELRTELKLAKKYGKKVIVYLEDWAKLPEYYLASVADKIFMPRLGKISHLGIGLEIQKASNFLNNFGIKSEVITNGVYKDGLSNLSEKFSTENREQIENLIRNIYHEVIADIKTDRSLAWETIGEVFDGRLISATTAKKLNLIDEFGYYDQVKNSLDKKHEITPVTDFHTAPGSSQIFSPWNKIAVLEIDGEIHLGSSKPNIIFGGKDTGVDELNKLIDEIKKDTTIKGVIIRINSPGGSAVAGDQIYNAIENLKASGKTVYTSIGNMGTSAGYLVALNSDKIIANPTSLTGSIGVISVLQQYETLNKVLGIEYEVVKTGQYMDSFSQNKKLTSDEKAMFQKVQDENYNYFVDLVIKNRNLTKTEIIPLAQGQIFTGAEAVNSKLIDKTGTFFDAVNLLAQDLNIKEKPELKFFRPSPTNLFGF